ncbi:MAG TPA: SDR family NAD(P)-dependent oxidoreductase, partial [Candidatus Acidoferrum sp.]|nr:SDR family NAD(P)-dependent oxidoreductase [Candidatus Acidoferrum sp.]
MEFEGQTAIVTGSARGFGRAICRRLARGGARVVAADINLPGAEETAALIREDSGEAFAIRTDVAASESVEAMIRATLSRFGDRVDILVNNAAVWTNVP